MHPGSDQRQVEAKPPGCESCRRLRTELHKMKKLTLSLHIINIALLGRVIAEVSLTSREGQPAPVFQEIKYDKTDFLSKDEGNKFIVTSIKDSDKIYIFDKKTKLLMAGVSSGGALMAENTPPICLAMDVGENFILSQQIGYKGFQWTITDISSSEKIMSFPGHPGRHGPTLFCENEKGQLGVFEGGEVTDSIWGASDFTSIKDCEKYYNDNQKNQYYHGAAWDWESWLKKHPELALKVGYFESAIERPGQKLKSGRQNIFISISSLSDGLKAGLYQFSDSNVKNLLTRFSSEIKNYSNKSQSKRLTSSPIVFNSKLSGDVLGVDFIENGKPLSIEINLLSLSVRRNNWTGPAIIHASLSVDLGGVQYRIPQVVNGDYRFNLEKYENGYYGNLYLNITSNEGKFLACFPPEFSTNAFSDPGSKAIYAMIYPDSAAPIVCLWKNTEKFSDIPKISLWNPASKSWILTTNAQCVMNHRSEASSHCFNNDFSQISISDSNNITTYSASDGSKKSQIKGITPFEVFTIDGNRIAGLPRMDQPVLEIWSKDPIHKICTLSWDVGGKASVVCDDGYYSTRDGRKQPFAFRIGNSAYPFEQFDLRLNRPDIVLERLGAPKEAIETAKSLREKRLKRMGVTEEMLKPDFHLPELQIVGEVPATTSKDQLDLQIKATDDKYPLDRLRVYVNNVPVNGRDGELLRDQKTQSLEKTIPIKLAAGRNKIQVSVLNSAGAESLYANAEVNCTAERPKPKLYAVALGVSQYDRPEWCLKYAAKDATDLIGKLKAKAGSSYSEVKPLLLTDKEVTKESTGKIKEFLSGATIDDTVLIFMAGHGLLDDKYDYYFGTTDIDPAKPSERGMPYEAIDTILAEVPSLKKALLMDTCHAGELDRDEKKELAASDGKGAPVPSDSSLKGKVAMRAIGTRGMQVKAVEGAKGKSDWYDKLQDMFVDLRRGSGATVISSSQGAEYAFESSEQSNGLFTYALMEALDGKATSNKNGQITISSIGDYVKKRVQDLTKGKQNPNLRGVNLEEDFSLVGNMPPVNAPVENNQISLPQNAVPPTANPSGDAMQGVIMKYHQAIQDRDEATVRSLLPDQVNYYKSGRVPMSEVLADIKGDWKRYSSTTYQVSDFQKIDDSTCRYVLDYSLVQEAKIRKGKLLMTATISIPDQKIASLKASVVSAH